MGLSIHTIAKVVSVCVCVSVCVSSFVQEYFLLEHDMDVILFQGCSYDIEGAIKARVLKSYHQFGRGNNFCGHTPGKNSI